MQHSHMTAGAGPQAEAIARQQGRYLYCVADAGNKARLGQIGIEGSEVYTIPYRDICAMVHDCPAEPYRSSDQEKVKSWVLAHQKVVDAAWDSWGTIIPLTFDTIIKETDGVEDWLRQEYERIRSQIERLKGKAEYGVQVFWNTRAVAQSITQTSPEIRALEKEIETRSRGLAYMYRHKLENLLKQEIEAKASQCFKDCYNRVRKHAADVRVEKTKAAEPGQQMLMNLSCLVSRDRYLELGDELDEIGHLEGFFVRFTGPWPPYSFVGGA